MNTKKKIVISIILVVLVLLIASFTFFVLYLTNNENILYEQTEEQLELGSSLDRFRIYDNGIIITYEYLVEDRFKITKISKDEVEKLKKLINTIEDNKEDIERPEGKIETTIKSVYSERLSKDIILHRTGSIHNYINTSENCEELLDLVQKIYEKHKQK